MQSDPIKAALEVATMLPCREANDRCLCHEAGALDMDTCGNELPDVAAAIAAFLDALREEKDGYLIEVPSLDDPMEECIWTGGFHSLAAAVRRAAGGE